MELLARIQLGSELDLLISELASGSLSMIEKIKKAGRLDQVVSLLTGEAGQAPAADPAATNTDTLWQFAAKRSPLGIRLKKDQRFTILFRRYSEQLNRSDRQTGQDFEHEMAIEVAQDVSGIQDDSIRLYKKLGDDLTKGTILIKKGKHFSIGQYIDPKKRKTPQVMEFLNWLYQQGHLLTGDMAKRDKDTSELLNDRNHFSQKRMKDGQMEVETFERGEKVKLFRGRNAPAKDATILGISHADKKIKYEQGLEADFSAVYKLDYDFFDSLRYDLESNVSTYENIKVIMDNNYHLILAKFKPYQDDLPYELEDAEERLKAAYILRLEHQKQSNQAAEDRNQAAADYAAKEKAKEVNRAQEIKDSLPEYVEMTMDQWKRTHKDFKHIEAGQRFVMRNVPGLGATMRPVKIIKEVKPEDEPLKDNAAIEAEANADFESEAAEHGQTGDSPIDEAGVFYQSIIDGAEIDSKLLEQALSYAQQDSSHYLLPEAAESIKKSVLNLAGMTTS